MVYSVWNKGTQSFDYFEGLGSLVDGQLPKRTLIGRRQLGMTPEESSARLPAGARKIGSGEFAKGVIATRGGVGLGFDLGGPSMKVILAALGVIWFIGGRR
jgi:hypothetical protein